MDRTARACAPEVFSTVYRLCVRLSRKTRFVPYLCAIHTPDAERAVQKLLPVLRGGEVLSAMDANLVYVLLLAEHEEQALFAQEQIACALPFADLRLQCVRAE